MAPVERRAAGPGLSRGGGRSACRSRASPPSAADGSLHRSSRQRQVAGSLAGTSRNLVAGSSSTAGRPPASPDGAEQGADSAPSANATAKPMPDVDVTSEQHREGLHVVCRVKPRAVRAPGQAETKSGPGTVALAEGSPPTAVREVMTGIEHEFEGVCGEMSTQEEVYAAAGGSSLVQHVLEGGAASLFAYGQTGSGKTHSMIGVPSAQLTAGSGIVPRVASALLAASDAGQTASRTRTRASRKASKNKERDQAASLVIQAAELYNERLYDLLGGDGTKPDSGDAAASLVASHSAASCAELGGAAVAVVRSAVDACAKVQQALEARTVAATAMNAESSRSHCIIALTPVVGAKPLGTFILCDLAGCEKAKRTGAEGASLVEACAINRSLSALGNVVAALATGKQHIPYRDSQLTMLLKNALGGGAKASMVICVSAEQADAEETLSTLRLGARARGIINTLTPARGTELDASAHAAVIAAEGARERAERELALAIDRASSKTALRKAVALSSALLAAWNLSLAWYMVPDIPA